MLGTYDISTVVLSFLIASLASFAAFESIDHMRSSSRKQLWTGVGGVTLGLGIWSMHFVGMLAWHPPFRLYYSLKYTLLSILLAVGASWLAMRLTMRVAGAGPWRKAAGALLVGSGICAMHFAGMGALRFSKPVMWHPLWVGASLLIAVLVSGAAMHLLDRSGERVLGAMQRLGASLVLGCAVCGMHYAGMQAMMLTPGGKCLHTPLSFAGPLLARIGVGNAMLFTLCLLVVSYNDKIGWAKAANEARFQAQEAARNAEQLAVAGKIAASIAHEINNPLEAVTNLLFLLEVGVLDEDQRSLLTQAQQEVERISEITTHTLKFYRQPSGPEDASIPELFESALTLFAKRLRENGITVEKHWPADIATVHCRAGEIRQVLANLVGNAMDAMRESGGVLRLGVAAMDGGLDIEVADTGKGIPVELQSMVLEPFFTTKGVAGTGLGLSISAEILGRHGGTMRFASSTAPGVSGTVFHLFLPYDGQPAQASLPVAPTAVPATLLSQPGVLLRGMAGHSHAL